ncbi:MAG: ketopantoate reductase family protein [Solirubrobacterales bacterium]
MRQAIMGAGSLGTILGALLTKNGYDVDLIDVWEDHVQALNQDGATITGKLDLNVPVRAITPDQMQGVYDIVFYLVKSTADHAALPKVKQHLAPAGFVAVMQNGLPEEKVSAFLGKERVIGCPIGWGATLLAPGISELTSDPEKMTYDIGELNGSDTPRLNQLQEILNHAGYAHQSNNIIGNRWSKLVGNSTFSAMSTVIGGTYGDVLDHPKALYCAACIGKEAIDLAAAAGVNMEPFQGADLRFLNFNTQEEYKNLIPIYQAVIGPHRPLRASMLQDLEKGKACEIDNINGVIVDWAARHNFSAPVNSQVVQIIKQIEKGQLSPCWSNLEQIEVSEYW